MADGRKHPIRQPSNMNVARRAADDHRRAVNDARAVRVAELMNDYRTLLLHISQQQVNVAPEDYNEEGFAVLRECHAAAQSLLSTNYHPCPVSGHNNAEAEKAELQRYLDGPQQTILQDANSLRETGSSSTAAPVASKHTRFIFEPLLPVDGP